MPAQHGDRLVDRGVLGPAEFGEVAFDPADEPADAGDLFLGGGGVGPAEGAAAMAALTLPVISPAGTRTAGMPITSSRVQALLAVLCVFRLLPHGFTNRDLRNHLAPLLGLPPEAMTSGQITYDLRRLRIHGLICRIPHSFRYQVTLAGLRQALFLTRLTQRFLIPGLAQLTDPSPPAPARLRAAARAYEASLDDLARQAGLAA